MSNTNTLSRHRNNIVGKTLLGRVRDSVMGTLIKGVQAARLRADPQFTSVPTGWGPPEIRLHFFYAGEISEREVRITEYAGASFFGVRYLADGGRVHEHYVPVALIAAQQELVRATIHQFFMEGTFTSPEYEQLCAEGHELRAVWVNVKEAEPA